MARKKSNRILGMAVGGLGLSLCLFALANVLSYFKTGAETVNKYDLGIHQLSNHNPNLKWLTDDQDIKGEINPYIRREIEQSYKDAWGILNLSLLHQKDLGLSENFTKTKVAQITEGFSFTSSINRSDLIVSFTDYKMESETLIESNGFYYSLRDTSNYKIVMTLQDGKWKVNKFYRKIDR